MVYRAIGLMSGSSLDGLDIAYCQFQFNAGKWSFEILKTDVIPFTSEWVEGHFGKKIQLTDRPKNILVSIIK